MKPTTTPHFRRSSLLLTLCAALCWGGCKDPKSDDDDHADGEKSDGGGPSLGSMGPLAKMFASSLTEPGPYEEPRKSDDFDKDKPHLLVMEWDKPITEVESISMFGTPNGKPLREIQDALLAAANDDNVEGIVVRANGFSIDMALAQELRASLAGLRAAGKSLDCHTEDVSDAAYHVLTACETIGLSPLGDVMITGAAATPIHIKGLLDRFGVKADFLHVGAYKGAAEPITRDEPSPEMIETLNALLEEIYAVSIRGLVDGRGLSEADAAATIDKALFLTQEAVRARLVDTVVTWEAFLDEKGKPWTRTGEAENPLQDMSALQRFVGLLPADKPSEPHVALVYAVGSVIDGKGAGIVGARQEIASRTLGAALRALAKDEAVKAVVLRISSGGGSARASELIWHAVEELKQSKPVVVSMGGVAASGGYYIAAGANKIFADPTTITGSIGVVGGKIVLGDALERIGVNNFEVKRGERALMWSSMRTWTDEERSTVQAMMKHTYDTFVARVASGRGMAPPAVDTVGQGRVWTGAAAKEKGLVDELGGLSEALAEARTLGGVEANIGVEVYPGKPTLRDLLSSFETLGVQAGQGAMLRAALADDVRGTLTALAGSAVAIKTLRMVDTLLALREARVWAVSWMQPL